MATVLVTGVGGASGIGAVRALQETTTHDTVGVDMDPDAPGLYLADAGRSIPPASDEDWGAVMGETVEEYDDCPWSWGWSYAISPSYDSRNASASPWP